MLNFDQQKIEITCDCGRKNYATFRQARLEQTIRCSCGTKIVLEDKNHSISKAKRDIEKSFKDLDKTIKSLNKSLKF